MVLLTAFHLFRAPKYENSALSQLTVRYNGYYRYRTVYINITVTIQSQTTNINWYIFMYVRFYTYVMEVFNSFIGVLLFVFYEKFCDPFLHHRTLWYMLFISNM